MKFFLLFFLVLTTLYGAKVVKLDKKYQKSKNCKACHIRIVKEWENSWHAKSHYENDEYFRKTMDYVAKKYRKSLNSIKVKCATCHNPRISVTNTDFDYEIKVLMGLDENSVVNKATKSDLINEGINCVVCHNIDKIHSSRDDSYRGINRVSWIKSGIMVGPFKDTSSPYHKIEYRDFIGKKSNKLCFVCHANDRSVKNLIFSNMQNEYKKNKKSCVDCHMGKKEIGVASNLKFLAKEAKKRKIRKHSFVGAHTSSMWRDALSLNIWQKDDEVIIMIKNPQPHNIPSGFGSRELIIDVTYKKENKIISKKSTSLTQHYKRRGTKPTIPHLAESSSKDMSIPAFGKKVLKVKKNIDATDVKIDIFYRLVNKEIHSLLKLQDVMWSKKNLITSKSLKLKN